MKKKLKKLVFSIFFALFFIFVSLNIFYSQSIPFIILQILTNPNKEDVVFFLKKIQYLKEFNQQLNYYKKEFDSDLENVVLADQKKRKEEINRLETLLTHNSKARDVLIKLSLVYLQEKNFQKAKEYYFKAKEIDPSIKINVLEEIFNR